MSDLVERLREHAKAAWLTLYKKHVCWEAADEIDRLHRELGAARRQAFIEAAKIADKAACAAAAKKRAQDAKSASGVSVLTGYIFAETEADAIAAALRKAAESD